MAFARRLNFGGGFWQRPGWETGVCFGFVLVFNVIVLFLSFFFFF